MKRWEIRFDDFGLVRVTMLRAVSADAAAEEFSEMYGYDVVEVLEVA